jgi:hypothetical protein
MEKEFKNKIIKDIKATGFPTELEVAKTMNSFKWDVQQNTTYLDYELNKSREIDIVARKVFHFLENEKLKFYVAINLIIEIKKSSKRPWVIFTIPCNKKEHSRFKGPGFGQLHYSENFSTDYLSAQSLMKEFPRNKETRIGTSFYEAFKSPDEPSKIYEAVLSSIKAAYYSRILESAEDVLSEKELEERNSSEFNKNAFQRIEIYMPLVIIDGILCDARMTNDENIDIIESGYIPLQISHSVKPYNNTYNYYPELVHKDYLTSFLTDIDNWGNSIINLWRKE